MEQHGTQSQPDPVYLRPTHLARRYGLGRSDLYELVNRGEIKHIKRGRAILVRVADFERWLSEQEQGGDLRAA